MRTYAKAKGRSEERFVMFYRWLYDSTAYRDLDTNARALFTELCIRFNGGNNGKISMSVREAASSINRNKDTASKAFQELQRKGLITVAHKATFSTRKNRMATTWFLTHLESGSNDKSKKATKEFMRWKGPDDDFLVTSGHPSEKTRKGKTQSEKNGPHGPTQQDKSKERSENNGPIGPTEPDQSCSNDTPNGPTGADTYRSTREGAPSSGIPVRGTDGHPSSSSVPLSASSSDPEIVEGDLDSSCGFRPKAAADYVGVTKKELNRLNRAGELAHFEDEHGHRRFSPLILDAYKGVTSEKRQNPCS